MKDTEATLLVLKSYVRKCEEIIDEHKHKRPFQTGDNWGYDDRYRVIPVDQCAWMENTLSAIRECVEDLGKSLSPEDADMTISGLIGLLEDKLAEHGDMKVFCGDMEELFVKVVEAEDNKHYGDKYLYLGNGSVG
ncbi:hypothetical protein [Geobacter sp.]|uniref:hypothetical protein n=1 Tax=Geobacter sp. TaxID=46610 RepID=UPI002601E57B|nr:hypothetical protein [Geobacter sp.]